MVLMTPNLKKNFLERCTHHRPPQCTLTEGLVLFLSVSVKVLPVTPLLRISLCIESSARILLGLRGYWKYVDLSGGHVRSRIFKTSGHEKTEQNLNFVAEVQKWISFIFSV